MQRRFQSGMRENPASDQRHGSRSAIDARWNENCIEEGNHPSLQPAATGERKQETVNSTTIVSSIKARGDARERAGGGGHQDTQAQCTGSDPEFEVLLNVAEAARLLRIHPKTLRVKAGHGIIPGIQIGRVWRFRVSMLNRWLEGITGYGQR